MKDLDKKIEDILFDKGVIIFADVPGDKKLKDVTSTVVAQIKTVILEALKAEMPNYKKPVDFTDYTDIDGSFMIDDENNIYLAEDFGYNQAIDDCLNVCNKLLGDGK